MNFVESERNLKYSLRMSFTDIPKEVLLDLFSSSRSIDWPATFSNPERSLEEISSSLGSLVNKVLSRITTGVVCRFLEFRPNTNENEKLITCIYESVSWAASTRFKSSKEQDYLKLDEDKVCDLLSSSPNLVVLYMLSNLTIDSLFSDE